MIGSYFQLFQEPNKLVNVMEELQTHISSGQIDLETNKNEKIDEVLNELFSEVKAIEDERVAEVLSKGQPLKCDDKVSNEGDTPKGI